MAATDNVNTGMESRACQVFDNAGVRVLESKCCLLCGNAGEERYCGLEDRDYKAPGEWKLRTCQGCAFGWLDPQPLPAEIGKLYGSYYTHERSEKYSNGSLQWKLREAVKLSVFGGGKDEGRHGQSIAVNLAIKFPLIRDWVGLDLLWMQRGVCGTLLDVGCGDGEFLREMKALGWQVMGVEPDHVAAEVARKASGSTVFAGNLEDAHLPDSSLDAIMMRHVVEHLPDPLSTLRECVRLLRPGGKVLVVTPNLLSLGHRQFRENWRGLESPRHLFLFSRSSLGKFAQKAGLEIQILRTSTQGSRSLWFASRANRRAGAREWVPYWIRSLRSLIFVVREEIARVLWAGSGEELYMVAGKPDPTGV